MVCFWGMKSLDIEQAERIIKDLSRERDVALGKGVLRLIGQYVEKNSRFS